MYDATALVKHAANLFTSTLRETERESEREREEAPLALRAARPHTVVYIGGCDQEEGEIECPNASLCSQDVRRGGAGETRGQPLHVHARGVRVFVYIN